MEMDFEVPDYFGSNITGMAAGSDDSLRLLDEYFSGDELLWHDDGGTVVAQPPCGWATTLPPTPPSPPSPPPPLANGQALERTFVGEAEMAKWLRQVFEADTGASTTATAGCTRSTDAATTAAGAADTPPERKSCCRRPHGRKASEQKRRDKIKEKLRTLRHLVPRSSKTDQVSTLDGVIRYMKSLQQQVQALSKGYATQTAAMFPAGAACAGAVGLPMAAAGGVVFPAGFVLRSSTAPPILPFVPIFPSMYQPPPDADDHVRTTTMFQAAPSFVAPKPQPRTDHSITSGVTRHATSTRKAKERSI